MIFDDLYELYYKSVMQNIRETIDNWSFAFEVKNLSDRRIFKFVDFRTESYSMSLPFVYKIVRQLTIKLIMQMMKKSSIDYIESTNDSEEDDIPELYDIPFVIIINGKMIGFLFTYSVDFNYNIEDTDLDYVYIVSLIESIDGNYSFKMSSDNNEYTKTITLEEFFDMFWKNEYTNLKRYIEKINHDIVEIIGYATISIPSKNELLKFKKAKMLMLKDFDYSSIIPESMKNDHNALNIINSNYINKGYYRALVGNSSFAESFISSEWYYESNSYINALEKTAIVVGYLKSIEQLLYTLIMTKIDTGKKFRRRDKNDKSNNIKRVAFSSKNLGTLDFCLGNLINYLYKNSRDSDTWLIDYHLVEDITSLILKYKDMYRNDHLHKDNINANEEIDEIRIQTIKIFYLVLGAFNLEEKSIDVLEISETDYEQTEPVNDEDFDNWAKTIQKNKYNEFNLDDFDDWIGIVLSNPELDYNDWVKIKRLGYDVNLIFFDKKPHSIYEDDYNKEHEKEKYNTKYYPYKFYYDAERYRGGKFDDYFLEEMKKYLNEGKNAIKLKAFKGIVVNYGQVIYERGN
ncbi:MAG: hypothetical protein K6F71_10035 [Ruminococcus sp.]|uniref:hypothetical protein n=1 Tax=Ruminococcus sp. TaxID=41978 RepID=UPI0025CC8E0B|nr:hypothetical protein [Ruminococcus sp.]MCR5541138.1 hypothetical protein [Ruminococcus sp.]